MPLLCILKGDLLNDRDLLQLHHVHGGLVCGANGRRSKLPPSYSRHT